MSEPSEVREIVGVRFFAGVGGSRCSVSLDGIEVAVNRALDAARAEERETCAKVAGNAFRVYLRSLGSTGTFEYDIDVAAAIRARGMEDASA